MEGKNEKQLMQQDVNFTKTNNKNCLPVKQLPYPSNIFKGNSGSRPIHVKLRPMAVVTNAMSAVICTLQQKLEGSFVAHMSGKADEIYFGLIELLNYFIDKATLRVCKIQIQRKTSLQKSH